jgi:hypothetical protein
MTDDPVLPSFPEDHFSNQMAILRSELTPILTGEFALLGVQEYMTEAAESFALVNEDDLPNFIANRLVDTGRAGVCGALACALINQPSSDQATEWSRIIGHVEAAVQKSQHETSQDRRVIQQLFARLDATPTSNTHIQEEILLGLSVQCYAWLLNLEDIDEDFFRIVRPT